jgi:hypothetical protein
MEVRLFVFLLLITLNSFSQKIHISPEMVTNEKAYYDAFLLFDEDSISDPLNGLIGPPTTVWQNWILNADFYPISAVIDLGVTHTITNISMYDGSGSGDVTIQSGTPFNWNAEFVDNMNAYQTWSQHNVNISTRYIRITIDNPNIQMSEIVMYGTASGIYNPPSPQSHIQPKMGEFLGINGFHVDPISKLKVTNHLREYHMWVWDEGGDPTLSANYPGYPNNQYGFSPSWVTGWDIDEFYDTATSEGIEIVPCLLTSPLWIVGANNTDSLENKPIGYNENTEDPASYVERADYFYQYAARYGNTSVPISNLKLKSDNQAKTGLGYINYIEDWNEQDKYWKGRHAMFHPFEYAAMLSADNDGHQNTLGNTVGAKNADPNIKMVMGGIAGLNLEYIKAMKYWSDYHRNGDFPADVINYHFYSNNVGGQVMGQSPQYAISPEDDNLYEDLKKLVDYRDAYLPGKEIWVSEFGYDTDTLSPIGCKPYGPFNNEEVQAMWIIRTYLACVAAGIDRTQMYMLADVWSTSDTAASPGMFNTSGLTSDSYTGYKPKVSYYYLYAFRERLQNMRFDGIVPSGNSNVNIYKFKSVSNGDSVAYCVWSPTHNNTMVNGYSLNVQGASNASLVELADNDTLGNESILPIVNNTVSVDVNENVKIIITEGGSINLDERNSENMSFSCRPNPSKGQFVINTDAFEGNNLILRNSLGQVLFNINVVNQDQTEVDITHIPNGLYYLGDNISNQWIEVIKAE